MVSNSKGWFSIVLKATTNTNNIYYFPAYNLRRILYFSASTASAHNQRIRITVYSFK